MKLILLCCLFLIVHVNSHKVWTWLQANDKILWNRYTYDSVENSCASFDRPVNYGAMCAKGTWGWKCLSLYEGSDCTGNEYKKHINYLGQSCYDSFDKNKGVFDIKFKTEFWARSAKTYNC